ncbi:ABC transporter substrate-binding protein [Ktedonosporobacter rubrisoli]|nr:ABC transporter substrate-binding protein [Ktedonosporobacter rubrisoli]
MKCPRCTFAGDFVQGRCPRCGYTFEEMPANPRSIPVANLPNGPITNPSAMPDTRPPGFSGIRQFMPSTDPLSMGEAKSLSMPGFAPQNIHVSGAWSLQSTAEKSVTGAEGKLLMRGDTLHNRYRILEHATLPKNQQDQGQAWLALDTQAMTRRRVLVRRVEFPGNPPQDMAQAVRTLASRLMEISHPGFPHIIDVFQEETSQYIIFQYPEGESLSVLLRQQSGALPEQEVAIYGRQLCELLVILAHQQPALVHGAISPDTIIISQDRSSASLIYMPLFLPQAPQATAAGYVAPEQVHGEIQPSIDLYALACTMHHAVTGFDPRERVAFFYPPARRLNPVISTGMETILARALRLSVPQRYSDASEMLRALQDLIASYPPPDLTSPPSSPIPVKAAPISPEQIRARSRRSMVRSLTTVGGLGTLLILLALFFLYGLPWLSTSKLTPADMQATATARQNAQNQAALNQEWQTELQAFKQNGIGISDGRIVFDAYTGRTNVELKKEAAQALLHGDVSSAVNLYNRVVSADPTDGESQIYNENLHILQQNAPYVTIVIAQALDNSPVNLESDRGQFQSEYLAQHEINSRNLLPNGLKLRLLIASSGTSNDNVAKVAQFVANRVTRAGNIDHIIGVMGWPYSSQSINAIDILAGVHIPLISQSASSVKLSGSSQYFFRVNPPDDKQGNMMGQVVVKNLQAKKILVLRDPNDIYSQSLADAFTKSIKAQGVASVQDTFNETKTTVEGYGRLVQEAIENNVDAIYLAGYNVDALRLAHAVGIAARAQPANTVLARLRIVGGDTLASTLGIGNGADADAAIVRNYPQDMARLIFTSFADHNEWNFEGVPPDQQPQFFSEWASTYQSSTMSSPAPDPTFNSLLSFDAVRVFTEACKYVQGPLTGESVRNALASLGQGAIPAYQGITGQIHFDNQGNPVDKALVVLQIVINADGKDVIQILQLSGKFR